MKKNIFNLILFIIFTTTLISCGGGKFSYTKSDMPNFPIDTETNRVVYTEVVNVDSTITKNQLFSKAREWFAKAYNSSINVVQMADKESGKIIGKALLSVKMKTVFNSDYDGGNINYTISVYLRDGKYKYEITDFYHEGAYTSSGTIPDGKSVVNMMNLNKGYWGNSYEKTYLYFLIQMDNKIKSLISDLKISMNTKTDNNGTDW